MFKSTISHHRDNNLPYEIWPFSGRSDYGSFIASNVNIPGQKLAMCDKVCIVTSVYFTVQLAQ